MSVAMPPWSDTIFLRFESSEAWAAARTAAGWPAAGSADAVTLDVIGRLYRLPVQTGTDAAGEPVYGDALLLPGWHVNVRLAGIALPAALIGAVVAPDPAQRDFA